MQKSNMSPPVWLSCLLLLGAWFLAGPSAVAQTTGLEIRDGSTRLEDGTWYLSARVYYGLNRDALEILQSGITLTFALQVDVERQRRWWVNETLVSLRQEFELAWQPLSRVYVVRDRETGDQRAHITLFAALNDLGLIRDLPVIEAARLQSGAEHRVGLRAQLDQQQLPGPLRFLAFWDDDYALESEWYWWPLVS